MGRQRPPRAAAWRTPALTRVHAHHRTLDLLAEINRDRKLTILLVSHDLSVVSNRVHHVLCLKNGRIECQGPPAAVLTPEMIGRIFGSGKQVYAHTHGDGSVCDHHHSHGH